MRATLAEEHTATFNAREFFQKISPNFLSKLGDIFFARHFLRVNYILYYNIKFF